MSILGKYLQPLGFGNLGNMKDFAHASRLYLDDYYALAPKNSWIYYVEFDVNPNAIIDPTWANRQKITEVGMLVKSSDLPSFDIQTEVMHQYNRKVVVQKGVEYNPITMVFHDDQSNVVHNLWLNYFRYYYSDSQPAIVNTSGTSKDQAFSNNKFSPPDNLFDPVNYGLNSSLVDQPFFRSITIYQMNRRLFTSYKLMNPIIKSWEHDKLEQSDGGKFAESKMSIQFETVLYSVGRVEKDNPTGFAIFRYDNSPSPLSIAGGGNSSLLGPGGIVDGAIDIFGDVSGLSINSEFNGLGGPSNPSDPLRLLGTAIKAGNLINNISRVSPSSLRAEGFTLLNQILRRTGQGGLNGLGQDLNLNLGNSLSTRGEFLGTPVSVLNSEGVGQDTVGGTTSNEESTSEKEAPTSDMSKNSKRQKNILAGVAAGLAVAGFVKATTDNKPRGTTVAPGKYFSAPAPLSNTTPIEFSNINSNSSVSAIRQSLNQLNAQWAKDLDFVSGQSTSPTTISQKLESAQSPQEFQAIQQEAQFVLTAVESLQSSVNNKYQAEYDRLTSLLSSAQTNTIKKGTTEIE